MDGYVFEGEEGGTEHTIFQEEFACAGRPQGSEGGEGKSPTADWPIKLAAASGFWFIGILCESDPSPPFFFFFVPGCCFVR